MSDFVLHDSYFDPECERIASYFCRLFVMIGNDSLQYAILDAEKNTFIGLADFHMTPRKANSSNTFERELQALFTEEEYLTKHYPAPVAGISSAFHTLVPSALYDQNEIKNYLGFNFRLPENFIEASDSIPELDAINVYLTAGATSEFLKKHIPDAVIVHRTSAFLKSACKLPCMYSGLPVVLMNVGDQQLDVAHFKSDTLAFYNTFPVKTREDVLYFTLYSLSQLKLRPETVHIIISGTVDEGSDMHKTLLQYFPEISFANPAGAFQYSPLLAQAPLHRYTELFALALCGS